MHFMEIGLFYSVRRDGVVTAAAAISENSERGNMVPTGATIGTIVPVDAQRLINHHTSRKEDI